MKNALRKILLTVITASTLALTGCKTFFSNVNNIINGVTFELKGEAKMDIPLFSTYEEKGVKAIIDDKDAANKVVISYYLNDKKVDEIKTDNYYTYNVKYSLNHKDYSGELTRQVNVIEPKEPIVLFSLNGGNEINVGLNTTYVDKGFTAKYNIEDISDKVTVSYYLNDTKVDSINTDTEVTYTIKYDLSYNGIEKHLERIVHIVDTEAIDINFLELGNKYTGDATFIKAGDADILIDAGSRQNSATTIANFIDQYCKDGVLEYVIATHAHQDHIAGFVGSNSDQDILKRYKIDTLIDFSLTNATSVIYNSYISLRDEKIASGDIAHHYTANDCIQQTNGASKVYDVAAGITMEVLDQKFYREKTSDENDYSVCTLFSQGENHYLFTGDLEKNGEASLVELNTLPEVQLFKGGHHGSYTANTDALLSVIKPQTVCICCCAGSDEYTKTPENMFPAQNAVDRIAKYTEKVYVTTVVSDDDKGYQSLNGNINFHSNKGTTYEVKGSNNSVILKDSEWFKKNRTWPSY